MTTSAKKTTWKPGESGNPKGRPKGATSAARLIGPKLPAVVAMLIKAALSGDIQAARVLIDKCLPSARAESSNQVIPNLAEATTPTAKAEAVIVAVGRGLISPTVAGELLTSLAAAMRVLEVDELKRRIETLEGRIE